MRRQKFTLYSLALVLCLSLVPFKAVSELNPHPRGDIAMNYSTDINDLTVLIDYGLIKGKATWYYDLNWDYQVDISDVTCMIDYLLTGEWRGITQYSVEIPDSALVITVNGVSFAMMPVEGCDSYDPYHNGNYDVSLKDFYIGQTEVTLALWEAVMGAPYDKCGMLYFPEEPQHPVDMLSWFDCREFITRLNELTGLKFHMPTKAQWMYAAQGGKYTHGYLYSGSNVMDEVGWYRYNNRYLPYGVSLTEYISNPVGQKAPNELGLYDMSGNVREWTRNFDMKDGDALPDVSEDDDRYAYGFVYGGSSTEPDTYCQTIYSFFTYRGTVGEDFGLRLALQKEDL